MNASLAPAKSTWQQKLAASRFFLTSTILHLLLLIVMSSLIIGAMNKRDDWEPEPGISVPTDSLPAPIDEPVDKLPEDIAPVAPVEPSSTRIEQLSTQAPSTFTVPKPPEIPPMRNSPFPGEGRWGSGKIGNSELPLSMRNRPGRGGTGNPKMTKIAESAVVRGLRWLREHQNPDGSWGEKYKGGMTGFALLCFLGHGETGDSADFGLSVNKAVDWIMVEGTKTQGHLNMNPDFSRSEDVYEHGICTYALGEYFTMSRDLRVMELLKQAVDLIVQGQGPRGGWMYKFDKTADDLSVSGWQIQALKAAHLTGLNLPGVDAALDKAVDGVEKIWKGANGAYGYRGNTDLKYSLTGVGVLAQLFWKGKPHEVYKGMDYIMDETAKNKPIKYKTENADLYAWYYHTQAALMYGGATWDKWIRWFQNEVTNAQNPDGSWPAPGLKNHGPMNEETLTGQVYRTTLCILMLESFYRYTPTTKI